jgi:hypothetical protein
MNAGFGAIAAARFFCFLFAVCVAGDLTLKGQAVLRESSSVSPFSYEAGGESSYVGTGEAKRGSRSVGDITEISSSAGVVAPRPQLQYLLSDNVTLFVGADLRETTFRMAENFGQSRGIPKLDNAILQYREVRATAGLTRKLSKNVSKEAVFPIGDSTIREQMISKCCLRMLYRSDALE